MAKQSKVPFHAPIIIEYDTCLEAFGDIIEKFIYGDFDDYIAYSGGPRSVLNDLTVVVHRPAADINFAHAGMTENRWKKFIREYLDLPTFRGFMGAIWSRQSGQEIAYHTPPVAGHSLGNCLLNLTINGHPPHRLVGFTRSSQITPTGALDLSFLALVAEKASEIIGLTETMPIVWTMGNCWLMVLAAGNWLSTREGEIERLREHVESGNSNWTAKETLKHIDNAINEKTINWATFRRMWARTRNNLAKLESGEPFDEFYPLLPYGLWGPFDFTETKALNTEQMEEYFTNTKKWLIHRIRPFRKFMTDRWGWRMPQTYDLLWSPDHPEYRAVQQVYNHGGSVETVGAVMDMLDVSTEEEAQQYCWPYYESYSAEKETDDVSNDG